MDGLMDGWIHGLMDEQKDIWMDGYKYRGREGSMDRTTDGLTHGWMD